MSREQIAKARALIDVGREDEAAGVLAEALASDGGQDGTAWCLLAVAHIRRGRNVQAVECARRAIELAPDSEWPHRLASVAELALGNVSRAVPAARESVRLAPHLADAHAQLACALAKGPPWMRREAAREADRALELAPADLQIQFMVANAALWRGKRRLAERGYRRVLEADPTHSAALNNLSIAQLRRGLPVAAATGFSRAAALDPARDRHRRNLDVAVGHWLALCSVGLIAPAVLDQWSTAAGGALLAAAAVATLLFLGRARMALGRSAWRYVTRVPYRNPRVGYRTLLTLAQVASLVAVPLAGRDGPSLAYLSIFVGCQTLVGYGARWASG